MEFDNTDWSNVNVHVLQSSATSNHVTKGKFFYIWEMWKITMYIILYYSCDDFEDDTVFILVFARERKYIRFGYFYAWLSFGAKL